MSYFGKTSKTNNFQRIEPKTIFLVLWISLCAVVLFLIVNGGLTATPPQTTNATVTSPIVSDAGMALVVVPKQDVSVGQRLTLDMFTLESKKISGIEDRVLTKISEVEGGFAMASLNANSVLLKDQLSYTEPVNAVTSKIPAGFRAVTIPVDAESGVEGWVRPGVRVDVVWISTLRGKNVVSVIVENTQILSAERSTDANGNPAENAVPRFVTLLTTANDAQRIQLAKRSGSLSLNLRGSGDQIEQGGNTITVDGLLNKEGEQQDIDKVGWVEVHNKQFEISSGGKLKPTQIKKEINVFNSDEKKE